MARWWVFDHDVAAHSGASASGCLISTSFGSFADALIPVKPYKEDCWFVYGPCAGYEWWVYDDCGDRRLFVITNEGGISSC